MQQNRWLKTIEDNPEHSRGYIARFKEKQDSGQDLHGEARFVDAMVERNATVLDAGCGFGRIGAQLGKLGHRVIGVDIDPELISHAKTHFPWAIWHHGDLTDFSPSDIDVKAATSGQSDIEPDVVPEKFDVIVAGGNVVCFVDPNTRVELYRNLGTLLEDDGRIVLGFGTKWDYEFDIFFSEIQRAGLVVDVKLSTWHLDPFTDESDFLVCILKNRSTSAAQAQPKNSLSIKGKVSE